MSNYSSMLRDPRWQRKRLKLLEAQEFTCQDCGDRESELHVHHGYYEKGKKPWEYPDDTMWVLCADCHTQRANNENQIKEKLARIESADIGFLNTLMNQKAFANIVFMLATRSCRILSTKNHDIALQVSNV